MDTNTSIDAAKLAMLGASSPVDVAQQQLQSPSIQPTSPAALDRELLQHYAYLRYGDAGIRDSSGRKQHICPVKTCGRRFSTPGNLSRHKRLHGPIKPLQCPVASCICAFRSENKLEKHMKFHLGIPVHVCPVPACGKTFSTAGNLNRHIKGHHPHIDPLALRRRSISSSDYSYSTSSSCDELDSVVSGSDDVTNWPCKTEPKDATVLTESSATEPLDSLVAMLDQDMDSSSSSCDDSDNSAVAMDVTAGLESESMLALLLQDVVGDGDDSTTNSISAAPSASSNAHNLLDDIIRFHISHIITNDSSRDDCALFV